VLALVSSLILAATGMSGMTELVVRLADATVHGNVCDFQ
jgi:hypothetical protein